MVHLQPPGPDALGTATGRAGQASRSANQPTTSAMGSRTWSIVSPLADGDRLVLERIEVEGDAVRGADLVLAAVAATDGLGLVVVAHPQGLEGGQQLPGRLLELGLLRQGQDGDLNGAMRWWRRRTVRVSSLTVSSS